MSGDEPSAGVALKPCPAMSMHTIDRGEPYAGWRRKDIWFVRCATCGCCTEYYATEAEAIAAWNTRAQAPAVCVSQNGSDVTQAGLSKADETQAPAVSGDVVRSWHPEDHLPADPTVRPPDGDIAGWCRFYAWHYGDEPWGVGKGDYGGGCQDICFQDAADEIDRLRAALPTIADARASALEEAAGVAEQLGQVVNARGLDNNLEAFAEDIAAAIRKLKDL